MVMGPMIAEACDMYFRESFVGVARAVRAAGRPLRGVF